MPSVRQLKLLNALVETGSVSAAAARIGITQPAASKSLSHLQDQAGFQIYSKQNGRILLTQKGASLLDEANRFVRIADEFEGIVTDIRERGAQRIRIATTQSIFGSSALANGLKLFSDEHPNVRFELESMTRAELIRAAETDRADVAIAYGPVLSPNVKTHIFGTSQLCAVAKRDGVLVDKDTVSAKDLAQHPSILFFPRSRHRQMIDHYFEISGHTPKVFAEVANASAMLSIARTGVAVGICDAFFLADRSDDDLDIRPIDGKMALKIAFVQRKNSEPSIYVNRLREILASTWPSF